MTLSHSHQRMIWTFSRLQRPQFDRQLVEGGRSFHIRSPKCVIESLPIVVATRSRSELYKEGKKVELQDWRLMWYQKDNYI